MSIPVFKNLENAVRTQQTYRRQKHVHPRVHAKHVDRLLGYKIPKIEIKLLKKYRAYDRENDQSNRKQHYEGTQTWVGLHPQVLLTPYNEIFEALSVCDAIKIEHVVDIGAAYGRVGLVANSLFPSTLFTGYEVLKQREVEGNRIFDFFELQNLQIVQKNILEDDFVLPKAEIYFIYDFSDSPDLCQILDELEGRIGKYDFYLVTKGERMDFLLEKKYKKFSLVKSIPSTCELRVYSSTTTMLKNTKE